MTRATEAVRPRSRSAHALRQEAHGVGRAARAAWDGPGRERDLVVQSLKASAAALLAWLVAGVWMGDPMALMAPWVAVVLVQATVFSSLMQAARQFTAICVGALLASMALAVTGHTLGAVALSVPLLMLLANWPRFGDQGIYGATTALFTLATGAAGATAVGHRVGQAALGAVIGLAVNAFVLPPIHLRDVRENLAALAEEAADVLYRVAGDLRDRASDAQGWSHASARLEHRLEALRSARRWSRESLRLTAAPLRAVRRSPAQIPPQQDDERWSRVTGHIRALTRTLAVAADDGRVSSAPDGPVLDAYARLLELIGGVCHAHGSRLRDGDGDLSVGDAAMTEMYDLLGRLRDGLREHAGQEAAGTTVLGTLLLQAENLWSETVPTGRKG
ncbi:aromatic acid exporter family protein [Streptomyces sp. NBC_00285]|uniref:FUSC family protein n=1 Tax=Streptomyces sp. NBC_00285 TaxID=2975700 RepID=UPI002E2A0F6A|nr:aromatic acid exporter family protein [Streptomyces sp. NBC_00285]